MIEPRPTVDCRRVVHFGQRNGTPYGYVVTARFASRGRVASAEAGATPTQGIPETPSGVAAIAAASRGTLMGDPVAPA